MKKSFAISDDRINNLKQLTSYKNSSAVAEKFKCSTRINNLKNKTIQTSCSSRTVAIRDKHVYSSYAHKSKVINGYLECCKSNHPSANLNQVLTNGNDAGGESMTNINAIDAQTISLTSLPTVRSLETRSGFSTAQLTSNGLEIVSENNDSSNCILLTAEGVTDLILDRLATWGQIQSTVFSTQAISYASDDNNLSVNQSLTVQNSQTRDNSNNSITITSDFTSNRIVINGNSGLPKQILVNGEDNGIYWSYSGGELAGTLGDVLGNGNTAYNNIDMNGNDIVNSNLDQLRLKIDPTPLPVVNSSNSFMPVNLNENTYYIQLFNYTV
jgi:hypothetical protein